MLMLERISGTLPGRQSQVNTKGGYPQLYIREVLQAYEGCDFDFLKPKSTEDLIFIEPTVGRS